jgi:hypothetical protein
VQRVTCPLTMPRTRFSVATSRHVPTSHTRTVLSADAKASRSPSEFHAQSCTVLFCHALDPLREASSLATSLQGLTLVPISAQLEPTTLSPVHSISDYIVPNIPRECVPKVMKLSSNVSDVFPKVLRQVEL